MVRGVVFLLLFQMVFKFSTSLPYEIKLNATLHPRNAMLFDGTIPMLTVGQLFTLRVYSKEEVEQISCHNKQYTKKIIGNHFKTKEMSDTIESQTLYNPITANATMNREWYCRLFYKLDEGLTQVNFNVTVRNPYVTNATTVTPITPSTPTKIIPGLASKSTKKTVTTPSTVTPETTSTRVDTDLSLEATKQTVTTTSTVTPETTSTRVIPDLPLKATKNKDSGFNVIVLAGIIVLIIIITVTVICVIVGFYRRKRKSELAKVFEVNYENLPRHSKGQMAKPAQCNDERENMYSVPYVENNYGVTNSSSETHYAAIATTGEMGPGSDYANLDNTSNQNQGQINKVLPGSQDTYAQVLKLDPKNSGTIKPEPNYAAVAKKGGTEPGCEYANLKKVPESQDVYAQVLPKAVPNSEPKYGRIMKTQPDYSAVALKGKRQSCEYANLNQKSTQANIQTQLDNDTNRAQVLPASKNTYGKVLPVISPKIYANLNEQSYANAGRRTSEYAEPAYCEPIKPRK